MRSLFFFFPLLFIHASGSPSIFVSFLSFFPFFPSHWLTRGRETELGSRQVGPRFGKPGVADLGGGNPFSTREKDDLQCSFSIPMVWFFFFSLSLSLSLISLPSSSYYTTSSLIRFFFYYAIFRLLLLLLHSVSIVFLFLVAILYDIMVPFFFLTA